MPLMPSAAAVKAACGRRSSAISTGHPLRIVEHPLEAGAMAIAFTVAVGMGVYSSMDEVDDLITISTHIEPNGCPRTAL